MKGDTPNNRNSPTEREKHLRKPLLFRQRGTVTECPTSPETELGELRETDFDVRNRVPGIDDGLLDEPGTSREPGIVTDSPPESRPGEDVPPARYPIDVNMYATKKTVAQGMMDLALLSANANQLRYVLESRSDVMYYYVNIVLICFSITLQLAVGVGLILIGRYNINREIDIPKADRINNFIILAIFLITVVNVFISAFGIEESEISGKLHGGSSSM